MGNYQILFEVTDGEPKIIGTKKLKSEMNKHIANTKDNGGLYPSKNGEKKMPNIQYINNPQGKAEYIVLSVSDYETLLEKVNLYDGLDDKEGMGKLTV